MDLGRLKPQGWMSSQRGVTVVVSWLAINLYGEADNSRLFRTFSKVSKINEGLLGILKIYFSVKKTPRPPGSICWPYPLMRIRTDDKCRHISDQPVKYPAPNTKAQVYNWIKRRAKRVKE